MYIRISASGAIDAIMLYPFFGAIEVPYNDDVFNRPWLYIYNSQSFIPLPPEEI